MKRAVQFLILSAILMTSCFVFSVSAQMEYTEGAYIYTVTDNCATIISCNDSFASDVEIPSTLGGYTVTGIGAYAFEYRGEVTSVKIPDSVVSIGQNAFNACAELKSADLGNGITKLPAWLFYNCAFLESVTIGDKVEKIDAAAFENCQRLNNITVSENNLKFSSADGVLFNKDKTEIICYPQGKSATSYTVPESVTAIGDGVFINTAALSKITIGSNVISISEGAFAGCENLESITVNENNKAYASADGVLFNKEKTSLVTYPQAKEAEAYEIPVSVTTILPYSFINCDNLTGVTLSDSIKTIGEYGFYSCSKLSDIKLPSGLTSIENGAFTLCSAIESITVPENISAIEKYVFTACKGLKEITLFDTVTAIGESAFEYCDHIATVNYTSNAEKWNAIDVETSNDSIKNAAINYNYFIVTGIELTKDYLNNINTVIKAWNIPADSIAYAAAYDADGNMLEIKSVSNDNLDITFTNSKADNVKLFIWNTNLSPVINEESKSL